MFMDIITLTFLLLPGLLDDIGFQFIKKCIHAVETRGESSLMILMIFWLYLANHKFCEYCSKVLRMRVFTGWLESVRRCTNSPTWGWVSCLPDQFDAWCWSLIDSWPWPHLHVSILHCTWVDRRKSDKLQLAVDGEWEVKTITSAIKHYFRWVSEPGAMQPLRLCYCIMKPSWCIPFILLQVIAGASSYIQFI